VDAGNLINNGTITSTGNITAPYFFGNVQGNIVGNVDAAGSNTQVQFNDTGDILGATAGMTFDKTSNALAVTGNVSGGNVTTVGLITATGNITGGNLITAGLISATGNITGGNLITGNLTITPNTGQIGNVIINNLNPYTVLPNNGCTTPNAGRIVVGNGWDGNYGSAYDPIARTRPARFTVWDKVDRTDTNGAASVVLVTNFMQTRLMNGNIGNGSTRNTTLINNINIGGGPAANITTTHNPGTVAAISSTVTVGNISPTTGGAASSANVGDITLAAATASLNLVQPMANSTVTTTYGVIAGTLPGGSEAKVTNVINYSNWNVNNGTGVANITPNLFVSYYHANSTGFFGNSQGVVTFNGYRSSPNYYAFKNDDTAAQSSLGSLRAYNEFQFLANTSGTVNINKNDGQIHYIAPTGNVTIGDFQNFVFNASNGNATVAVANIAQTDTVTIIVQQGATPYTVTMPTGNAAIKYAGAISAVGSSATAATMISITGTKVGNAATAGTGLYLVTVSPEFV
jgi:hypothetical protein